MAARGLGPERARRVAGRQLPDPRHALQPGRAAQVHDRCRRRLDRRSDAGAHGGDRRARAAVRRRHLHAHRLRLARRRRQPRGASASTTRARTSGPSATRSGAGWSRSSRGRSPTRSSTQKAIGRFMPPVFPGTRADTLAGAGARSSACPSAPSCTPSSAYNAACRAGTLRPHRARRLPHRGPGAGQDALGAADRHAAVLRLRAAARRHLHLPRPEDRRDAPRCTSAAGRATTCSWPAR